MCIRDRLEYEVEEQRYSLQPGDSLLFASKLRHRWRNPGKTVAKVLFVLSGFALDERPSEFHLSYGKQEMEEKLEEKLDS